MTDHYLPGTPPIAVLLRRSGRARRISLRVSQLDGRVTLTLPDTVSEAEALDFAASKADWVRGHLANRDDDILVADGAGIPVEGRVRVIRTERRRGVLIEPDGLVVPQDRPGARLRAFLQAMARDRLAEASDRYAGDLGRKYTRMTLRDTRSRWGSCSGNGGLMFSWRLILAPPEVLQYVAAHEVAHLQEMNHSSAFWDLVHRLYGPNQTERRWLREHGAGLHRFRF
ncbi:MAG: M48 family metallopeptidase [Marinibacterium sp.]